MYYAQLTIDRIQSLIKGKGFKQKDVLSECGINENTLKRMTDNKGISSFYLAKISDYLDCSVDYLLGRTDNPQAHKENAVYGDLSNNSGTFGNVSVGNTINNNIVVDQQTAALLDTFNKLTPVEQAKVLVYADELTNK